MTVAVVTGATGQDGSYLCERLLAEGVELHAVVLADQPPHPWLSTACIHQIDLRDHSDLDRLVAETAPDELYNLAGISSVARSWDEPVLNAQVNAMSVAVLLRACWELQRKKGAPVRFVQASSSEIFGRASESPQTEGTAIAPTNPYGAAKAYAHQLVGVYRGLGLHASSCILYNHESPRRPTTFVTRKITDAVARISRGEQERLSLGSLDTRRDWGWAPDYVDGLMLAARHHQPLDVVLATGETRSIGDFVDAAFRVVGIAQWRELVDLDDTLTRPVETVEQRGDATRARDLLGWRATVDFDELVRRMVAADLAVGDTADVE